MSEATTEVGTTEGRTTIVEEGATIAEVVNELHRNAQSYAVTAVEDAIRCGEVLAGQKESLKHGEWKDWVEGNCDFSYRTARLYMQASRQNGKGLPFSSLSQLYGPEPEGKGTNVDKEDAARDVMPPPAQIQADIDTMNYALEEMQVPMMSADAFVSEAGTEFLTKKAKQRFDWLVELADMFASARDGT